MTQREKIVEEIKGVLIDIPGEAKALPSIAEKLEELEAAYQQHPLTGTPEEMIEDFTQLVNSRHEKAFALYDALYDFVAAILDNEERMAKIGKEAKALFGGATDEKPDHSDN